MWWELPLLYKTSPIFLARSSLASCLWFSVNQIMTWLDLAYWVIENESYLTGKKIYFSCWQDSTFQALVVITLKTHIFTVFAKLHNIFFFKGNMSGQASILVEQNKNVVIKECIMPRSKCVHWKCQICIYIYVDWLLQSKCDFRIRHRLFFCMFFENWLLFTALLCA